MSDEENRFMWNLAFFFTIKHRAAAFKAFYSIRSFITFNGIFMGPGYGLGDKSVCIFAKKWSLCQSMVGIFGEASWSTPPFSSWLVDGSGGSFSLVSDTNRARVGIDF